MRHWFFASLALLLASCGGGTLTEIQRAKSGSLDVVLLSSSGAIKHGQDAFVIEFRKPDGSLVDVGDVKATSTMPMPGAPMLGSLDVKRGATTGRYDVAAKFDMAGTWRTTIQWTGASEPGSVVLSGNIQ